jgi:hypothetical protein
MIIRKVWKAKATGVKFVSIPKDCSIIEGDYVKIELVTE